MTTKPLEAPSKEEMKANSGNEQPFEGALPLRLTSIVVRGYGRGSTDLGIPTANLSRDKIKLNLVGASFDDLPTGTWIRFGTWYWKGYCLSFVFYSIKR